MEERPRKSGGFLSVEISKWLADPYGVELSEDPEKLADGLQKAMERHSLLRRVKKLEGERTQKSEKRTQLTKREKSHTLPPPPVRCSGGTDFSFTICA